jgi:predicted ester cyclase
MEQLQKNKEFIIKYGTALSGEDKPIELLKEYVEDEALIEHILFFEAAFPKYELLIDEITAEDNRVIIHARFRGQHLGDLNGIAPTFKTAEVPLAVGYTIDNNKIISHWIEINQLTLMEQLGVANVPA